MPSDIRFSEIKQLLTKNGWSLARTSGSHHIFTGPDRPLISIPVHKGKAKDVYRRQVEKAIREQEARDQEQGDA